MVKQSYLNVHETEQIVTVTLDRQQKHNAFDEALIADLIQTLDNINADPNARVVILAANGKSFSAGADLKWMRRMAEYSFEENLTDAMQLARLMEVLSNLNKPTIAKVQGAAIGGGAGLVACCDIAIAGTQALFSFSETRLGLIPAVISPYVIACIGERQARRYFLTAERFDAKVAQDIGLVHEVVRSNQLTKRTLSLARLIKANGPDALTSAKQLINGVINRPINEDVLRWTAQKIAEVRESPEGKEGIAAFLEKRAASWTL